MKLTFPFLFSIFCVTTISAMQGSPTVPDGVCTVDAKSFNEVLKIGTSDAISAWARGQKVDLNTRCIAFEGVAGRVGMMYRYPIEHVICMYGGSKSLESLLLVLITLKVPIEGYHDYSPERHARGARLNQVMTVLSNLNTDTKVSSEPAVSSSQNNNTAQPQISTNAQSVAEQNTQVPQDESLKSRMFTTQQVIIISLISVLCGIGIKTLYDWYVGDGQQEDVDNPIHSEVV